MAVLAQPPAESAVSAALTETDIRVNSAFRGARIVLYGAVYNPEGPPPDVVVVVRGPVQPLRVVHKVKVAGVWANSRPVIFEGAPGFYMAASSRPLEEIADFGSLRRLGIGVDHLKIAAPTETRVETRYGVRDVVVSRLGADYLEWRRAVIRLKEDASLYDVDPQGVRFVDRGLFRSEVRLPAEAPIGRYETEVWLFQDGEPVSLRRRALTVAKVGLERALYDFANERPWAYGVISVFIALASGWAASTLLRRS